MIPYLWLEEAATRIASYIRTTPLTYDAQQDVYLKWENYQVTGSFKARGALNKVLSLEKWEQEAGLLAASAGNHGQGLALAGNLVGAPVTIYAAQNASPAKVEAMQALGAQVILVPGGYGDAEAIALDQAAKSAATWVSPYNDPQVIAGQGTLGLETLSQLANHPKYQGEALHWVVPTSGGGLLSGIGAALSKQYPKPRLIAVQSEASAFMHALYHSGSQAGIPEQPSIADGLAGPVEPHAITIPLVRTFADDFFLVSEAETREALRYAWEQYGERIEGSAAVALAALLNGQMPERPAVVIISGGNIQTELFQQIIRPALSESKRAGFQ